MRSIGGDTTKMVEKYAEGRSSSWIYYTEDGKYCVKTVSEAEAAALVRILPDYEGNISSNPSKYQLLEKLLKNINNKYATIELLRKNIKDKMELLRKSTKL
jgi:hypothetical protein